MLLDYNQTACPVAFIVVNQFHSTRRSKYHWQIKNCWSIQDWHTISLRPLKYSNLKFKGGCTVRRISRRTICPRNVPIRRQKWFLVVLCFVYYISCCFFLFSLERSIGNEREGAQWHGECESIVADALLKRLSTQWDLRRFAVTKNNIFFL